jgi:hypothetical protein
MIRNWAFGVQKDESDRAAVGMLRQSMLASGNVGPLEDGWRRIVGGRGASPSRYPEGGGQEQDRIAAEEGPHITFPPRGVTRKSGNTG